jgi:phosphoglycerate dehydrogenase-like enzyme
MGNESEPRGEPRGAFAGRVVLALTARERRLFFRPADACAEPLAEARALPERELTEEGWEAVLAREAPEVLVTGWSTPPLPEAWLAADGCPLRYVCHVTGSVRRLVPRSFLERGGKVSNWGEQVGPQVAEHALLLALAALRNVAAWRGFIARPPEGRRIEELGTRTLFGRSVALHGFGAVARELVKLLRPFGVSLHGFSAGVPEALFVAAGVTPCRDPVDLFRRGEVVFECEALTPSTAGSVTAEAIAALPVGAVFVNVGRGAVVDEAALVAASRGGRIRLALDVVAEEPLTPDAPVALLHDAVLSPHIAGPTVDRYPNCGSRVVANITRHLRGQPPEAQLTLAEYDRAT